MPRLTPIGLWVLFALLTAASVARAEETAPSEGATPQREPERNRSVDGEYSQGGFAVGGGVAVAGGTDGAIGAGFSPSVRLQGIDVGGPGIAVIVDMNGRAIAGGVSGGGEAFGGGTGGLDFSIGYVTATSGCGLRLGGGSSLRLGQFGTEEGERVRTADSIDLARVEAGLLCHEDVTTFLLTPYAGFGMGVLGGYRTHASAGVSSRLWVGDRVSAHAAAGAELPVRMSAEEGGPGQGPRLQVDAGVDVRVSERVFGSTSDLTVGAAFQALAPVGEGGGPAGFMGAASAGFTF